ncbi:MAG TPA: hypothetical protein VJ810_15985 [Blastocatellia bacterium]|nr:hypothetical protein [Blastocatellia bacterium]
MTTVFRWFRAASPPANFHRASGAEAESVFAYYGQVMADGALTRRKRL